MECRAETTRGTPIDMGAELVEGGPALVDHGAVALARAGGEVGAAHGAQARTVGPAQPRVVNRQQDVLANHRCQVDLPVLDGERFIVLGWVLGVTLIDVDDERLGERPQTAPALAVPGHLDRPGDSDVVESRVELEFDGQLTGDRVVKRVNVQWGDFGRNDAMKARLSEQLGSVDAEKAGGHDTSLPRRADW